MVTQATLARIQTELQTLSEALGDSIPRWGVVPGSTSVFIHPSPPIPCSSCQFPIPVEQARIVRSTRCPNCGTILFGQAALEDLETRNDEVDLAGLVAHEYWHFIQMRRGLHQDQPHIREVNARRFARQWTQRRFPGREREFNLQPIRLGDEETPGEPGVVIDFQEQQETMSASQAERFAGATPEDLLFLEESFKPHGRPISTPLWIRFKLQRDGPSYAWAIWRDFRDFLKKFNYKWPTYGSIRTLLWILHHDLGFLKKVGETESEFGDDRTVFDLVSRFADDPRWSDPRGEVYGRTA